MAIDELRAPQEPFNLKPKTLIKVNRRSVRGECAQSQTPKIEMMPAVFDRKAHGIGAEPFASIFAIAHQNAHNCRSVNRMYFGDLDMTDDLWRMRLANGEEHTSGITRCV